MFAFKSIMPIIIMLKPWSRKCGSFGGFGGFFCVVVLFSSFIFLYTTH